jgi:hypothetical protein
MILGAARSNNRQARSGWGVIVCMVPMVGKLILCCEQSCCCGGGGGGLGSDFDWIVWEFDVGYVFAMGHGMVCMMLTGHMVYIYACVCQYWTYGCGQVGTFLAWG